MSSELGECHVVESVAVEFRLFHVAQLLKERICSGCASSSQYNGQSALVCFKRPDQIRSADGVSQVVGYTSPEIVDSPMPGRNQKVLCHVHYLCDAPDRKSA